MATQTVSSKSPSRSNFKNTYFPPGVETVEGTNFTEETLAYMTPYKKANNLARTVGKIFKAQYVIDASAGIGGNTLGFALHNDIKKVISYEAKRDRWEMLSNNIALYNLGEKVLTYNQSFEIGEDLQLLDVNDPFINQKAVVYFDPPWIPDNASIDKSNYILSGIKLCEKTLEYWCRVLTKQGYLGVILHVPPTYNLILSDQLIDDTSDKKSRLIYYTLNQEIRKSLVKELNAVEIAQVMTNQNEEMKDEEIPSYEKGLGDIPPPVAVKGPKMILQTYLTHDFPRRRYMREGHNPKSIHLGQRKLLLSEIEFLTRVIKNNPKPEYSVESKAIGKESSKFSYLLLYVGAAPGQHIPILSEMFPEVKFVLYDPAPFKIKPSATIEIHQELFTDEVAKTYTDTPNLLLVSDIRSTPRANYQPDTEEADSEFENEVRKNLLQQKQWVETIRPFRSLLKFRLPFTDESEKAVTEYFDGIINFQAYAPPQSAETRLEIGSKPKMTSYDHTRYEQQMFYFNTWYRTQSFVHYNRRYGWSYDTVREFFILKKYITLRGEGEKNIPGYFAKFDELTDKPEKKISRILEKY